MNVAIFGGTFDPVHRGHLAVARAARRRYKLGKIYFVPADIPPHKQRRPITAYHHRFAMLVLATQGEKGFVASLAEARDGEARPAPSYSISTVRRFRAQLAGRDRLFFIIGADAFLDIGKWHRAAELLQEVEFIIASRPGFSLADAARALPPTVRPKGLHLMPGVAQDISATQIRQALTQKRKLTRWLPSAVADYIHKEHLYEKAKRGLGRK